MALTTSFGLEHDAYRRFRPSYPEALYQRIFDRLERPRTTAVDLGAGTGLVSRVLGESFARVIAVEPDPEMAAHLQETAPHAEVLPLPAEQVRFPPASVDLVTCANAFHWMPGREVATAIGEWLADDGLFAGWRYPMPKMPPQIADLLGEELPRWAAFMDRRSMDMNSMQACLGERPELELLAPELFEHRVEMQVEELVGFLRSVSFVANFLRDLGEVGASDYLTDISARLRGRVGEGRVVLEFPLTLVLARRRPR